MPDRVVGGLRTNLGNEFRYDAEYSSSIEPQSLWG